jgi:hypothetical protein
MPEGDVNTKPPVGLWQGGFYSPCVYFRSQETCRMDAYKDPFCQGCLDAFDRFFLGAGMRPCQQRWNPRAMKVDFDLLEVLPPREGLPPWPEDPGAPPPPPPPPANPWRLNGTTLVSFAGLYEEIRGDFLRPLGRLRATVDLGGVIGEIEVSEVRLDLTPGDGVAAELVIRSRPGAPYRRLDWIYRGQVLPEGSVPDDRSALPAFLFPEESWELTVVDRLSGEELPAERVELQLWDLPDTPSSAARKTERPPRR